MPTYKVIHINSHRTLAYFQVGSTVEARLCFLGWLLEGGWNVKPSQVVAGVERLSCWKQFYLTEEKEND